jgi:hypothetical protein
VTEDADIPRCLHCAILSTIMQWVATHGDKDPDGNGATTNFGTISVAIAAAIAELTRDAPKTDRNRAVREAIQDILAATTGEIDIEGHKPTIN